MENEIVISEAVITEMPVIDFALVEQCYTGKPGCRCGCLGNYFQDEKNFKRIYNKLVANQKNGVIVSFNKDRVPYIFDAEIAGRWYTIYLGKKKEEEA